MDWERTGVRASGRASALEVDRLLGVASREELSECLRLMAVALAITNEGQPRESAPTRAATPAELDGLIESNYPRAMLTLAAFLRGVLEDGGSTPLH